MKTLYIVLIGLFLMNGAHGQGSVHVSPSDAFVQRNHPTLTPQQRKLNSIATIKEMVTDRNWQVSDLTPDKKSKESFSHRTPQHCSLIQLYDSIYIWDWDTLSIEWKINYKITDFIYDANNNLTSETDYKWDGSAWVKYSLINNTYDASSNLTSELNKIWTGSTLENPAIMTP